MQRRTRWTLSPGEGALTLVAVLVLIAGVLQLRQLW